MESIIILVGAIGFSYLLNEILLKFSRNFGVDSRQSQNIVRWSSTRKPTTGGISFYITFLLATILLLIIHPELASGKSRYLGLFISASLAFLIGFADDAYGTHPLLKFLGQMLCGVILLAFGMQIQFFTLWAPYLWPLDYGLTIFWVVGIMNSLNMLDNMDAVTTTIALSIIVISMGMLIAMEGLNNLFYILIAISGSFVGFLFMNWRPARIYMGDTGSMFIGLVLAYVGIMFFWNVEASPDNVSHIRKGLIPLLVFLVPIMDTSFVTFARISRGSSPFVGGKDHLTHQLVRVGVPEAMVPVMLGSISIISGLLAIMMWKLIPDWDAIYSLLFALYPIALVSLFAYLYLKGARIARMKEQLNEQQQQAEPFHLVKKPLSKQESGIVSS
ncbi:MAG: undecaprenyl/decaprenyl-phosphate alpha-N-acetylglucosaminyl 1-phosphate transferase [Bacteroidetes bacterium]|nr:MAG: undecaprenyl/decaprenyl-phosphate alpha-N-acetylglucosaminyl 1-phosphate transferase [Bacteroidota bacterium]